LVLACEALRGSATLLSSPVWPTLQAAVAAGGLVIVWRRQQRLRLAGVVSIGLAFQLGWIALHLALGVRSDGDSSVVYSNEGHALLSGTYPHSEYPPGAVLLFAFESLLSGGGHADRVSNAFAMVPFQLATVLGVWALRTRWSAWLAAVVAIWPLNAFFWEFKFDAAPTAALVIGLLLARRRRWSWSGIALGVGTALKWTPALSGLVLAAWLIARGRPRTAAAHLFALLATFMLINLPFLVGSPSAVLAAYGHQGGRGISAESLFYIPPVIGFVRSPAIISHEVGAPAWANLAAIVLQAVAVLVIVVAVARVDGLDRAVALAAMAPVAFLLTNRVFSPQYLVTLVAMWAVAGALLAGSSRAQLRLALLVFGATLANVLVYPTGTRLWPTFTAILFGFSFAATTWVVAHSLEHRPAGAQPGTAAGERAL
jgi:hypothetical protein